MKLTNLRHTKRVSAIFTFSGLILYVLFNCCSAVFAQDQATIGETDIRPFAISGNLSLISEGYAVRGIESRRPPGLGQIHLNTNFTIMGLQSGINILYSTDDNKLRQSMNQFNFQASWRWLTVAAGTVSPRFAKYSMSGVSVTGGLIEINPGWFSLAVTGGRSRRAVGYSQQPGFRQASFERWLYASRIGFGSKQATEFALTALYAYDVTGSVNETGSRLPAKNVSLAPELQLSLFDNKWVTKGVASFNLFTRNRESTALELEELEQMDAIVDVIEPNSSSRIDYAGEISSRLNIGPLRINGSYERVQPGYASLGISHIRSDLEQYRLRTQLRLLKGRANVSGSYISGRNNLLNTRISTLRREQVSSTLSLRIARKLNVNLSFMNMLNENKPVSNNQASANELHSRLISQNIMLSPTFVMQMGNISHAVSITSSFQTLKDESRMVIAGNRPPSSFESLTAGLNYGINLPSSLSLNVAGNIMHNTTPASTTMGNAINISGGYSFFERKLTSNMSIGWSRNGIEFVRIITDPDYLDIPEGSKVRRPAGQLSSNGDDFLEGDYLVEQWSHQYSMNISLGYRFANNNTLRFTARGLLSRPQHEEGRHFNEVHAALRYQHRF